MPQTVDVAQFAFAAEDFLGPFTREAEGAREGPEEFDDLRDVVVVFAVFGAGLGIEEVVACYQLEDLVTKKWSDMLTGYSRTREDSVGQATHHCCHTPHVSAGAPFGT